MENFKTLILILMSSVLVNNYVLNRFLGICPFLGVSKKLNQAVGMGVAVIFVMLLASAVTWPIQYFVLNGLGLGYMQNLLFILIIAALVQLVEITLKKYIPSLHKSLGVYLPLITTNCAVLGVAILNMQNNSMSFLKGMGAGMIAGAAVITVGKMVLKDQKNISKGSAKLVKAVGEMVDGVQTIFK